jgi:hypothetical protein
MTFEFQPASKEELERRGVLPEQPIAEESKAVEKVETTVQKLVRKVSKKNAI